MLQFLDLPLILSGLLLQLGGLVSGIDTLGSDPGVVVIGELDDVLELADDLLLLGELLPQLLQGLALPGLSLILHQIALLVVEDDAVVSMRLLEGTRTVVAQLIVTHDLRGLYLDIDVPRRLPNVLAAVDGSGGAIEFLPFIISGLNNPRGVQLATGRDGQRNIFEFILLRSIRHSLYD